MRDSFHSLATIAISIAALLFVAWISLAAGGPESLYVDKAHAAANG